MSASSATDWLNEDGTAKDPSGYKELLRSDPERWAKIEQHPEAAAIILGDDIDAFQELLKAASEAEKKVADIRNREMSERTIDAQRVSATVPRDTVTIYERLHESGLQYGPSFRLLRNVHVPDANDHSA
mmetsp:Transcript_17323/g.30930  ORF Transcript_17323/g.30930 Transcript_17323/m.30930 type:complete len:129 (-) Transcript_17323:160-546(-)